jgi:hypothetical protein
VDKLTLPVWTFPGVPPGIPGMENPKFKDPYQGLALIAHELAHSAQEYLSSQKHKDGGQAYLADYLGQFAKNLADKKAKPDEAITYEIVGYAVERAVRKMFDLRNPNGAANRLAFEKLISFTPAFGPPGDKIAVYGATPMVSPKEAKALSDEFKKYYREQRDMLRQEHGMMKVDVEAIP